MTNYKCVLVRKIILKELERCQVPIGVNSEVKGEQFVLTEWLHHLMAKLDQR